MTESIAFYVGQVPVYGDVILAPLAGYSDHPYRSICRHMGSAMSYTEFVSAQGVLRHNKRTMEILRFDTSERPVVFQVFGQDLDSITEVCIRLQDMGPDIIDINLGCPSARIAGRGGGAGLLRTPGKVGRIFRALSAQLSIPVTAKIRLGWNDESRNHLEIARILEDSGAALIAVHGRTRQDDYSVPADWDAIAEVRQAVGIPVLGNGDVYQVPDIDRLKQHTKCDGVMIGRGAIGNPWIFQRREPTDVPMEERALVIRDHLERIVQFYGEHRGILSFRKHLVQYIRGMPGANRLRAELVRCATKEEVLRQLESFWHPIPNVL